MTGGESKGPRGAELFVPRRPLYRPRVHFHGCGLLEELDGEHQPKLSLFAPQDSLDGFQRTILGSNPISAIQEGIGFDVHAAREGLAYRLDLSVGNDRWDSGETHQTQDAGRGQNSDLVFKFPSQEDVAREQWRGKLPRPITPLSNGGVLRQEHRSEERRVGKE